MKAWCSKYKFFILGILAIAGFVGLYGYREYNRGLPDTHFLKSAFNLDGSELVRQFENDELKATTKYADKTITVHGTVGAIRTTDTSASVFLNDGSSLASVMCQFGKENVDDIKSLRNGGLVTIKGICSGYLMDVILVRCVIND